jgi:diguanylate cyclase (GGDEF)-like protein
MIPLKSHLLDQEADRRLPLLLEAFRAVLKAIGAYGTQACPAVSAGLKMELDSLADRLTDEITPAEIKQTGRAAEKELQKWGQLSSEYLKQKTNEVKEMLIVMARTAEGVAERDQRYSTRFSDLGAHLQALAGQEDATQIATSLLRSAAELKSCVVKMAQEGEESVLQLKAKVSTYQSLLEEAEQLASRDPLTGLYNRRLVEAMMEYRITRQWPFCVVMLDLDHFKAVNDQFGHLAGDHLLKQFASELRTSLRATDNVGRWGGDEFVVILDSNLRDVKAMIARMQRWFLGKYSIPHAAGAYKVNVSAAIGLAEWKTGESMQDVIGHAAHAVYQQKNQRQILRQKN